MMRWAFPGSLGMEGGLSGRADTADITVEEYTGGSVGKIEKYAAEQEGRMPLKESAEWSPSGSD